MQLWPFMSHSGFLLESRFSDFFKFAIFSTKISLFLQIHFNLLEDKHSFGYFWTPKSTYDICSVFLYMLSYTLSPKNSKIEILFCQTLRPECNVPFFPGPKNRTKRGPSVLFLPWFYRFLWFLGAEFSTKF